MNEVKVFDSYLLYQELMEMYYNLLDIPLFDDLEKETEKAIERLKEINLNGVANYLLTKSVPDENDGYLCNAIVMLTAFIYNETTKESPLTDSLYDSLFELNKSLNNLEVVGSSFNIAGKTVVNHNYTALRGTLDKIHFIYEKDKLNEKNKKSIEYWLASVKRRLVEQVGEDRALILMSKLNILTMPKYDGTSLILELDSDHKVKAALTRGDVDKNEATELSSIFGGLDLSYLDTDFDNMECGVKCECIMTTKQYERYCSVYGHFNNPRAAVVSALGNISHGPEVLPFLTICPLRVQGKGEDGVSIYTKMNEDSIFVDEINANSSDLSFFANRIDTIRNNMNEKGFPIDGVVFIIDNPEIQKLLGRRNDKINNYEFAYKFDCEKFKTKIINIEWQYGKMGGITPVGVLEPLKMNGNDVSHVTLSSISKIKSLDLSPLDEVLITYNIVPYITVDDTCIKSGLPRFEIPKICPKCGGELDLSESGAMLKCNNASCPSRGIGKLVNYIEKMRIKDINMSTVSKFFVADIMTSIEDIYKLSNHKNKIISMPGFGERSYLNMIRNINSRLEVFDYEVLGALGIRDVGIQKFKTILSIYNLDVLIEICSNMDIDSLTSVSGIGSKTAEKIIEGINLNKELIRFLIGKLRIKEGGKEKNELVVCFTGFRDAEFKEFLESKNIEVKEGYTKKVNMVIYEEVQDSNGNLVRPESKKIDKALEDGKQLISKREAYELFKE